jgi:hypothetical protein
MQVGQTKNLNSNFLLIIYTKDKLKKSIELEKDYTEDLDKALEKDLQKKFFEFSLQRKNFILKISEKHKNVFS